MKAIIKDIKLYYVGGVVRDEILGAPSFDIDFCYEGNAIEFSKNLNVIKTNPDFGTVRVLVNDIEIDIASTRSEKYPKAGHLPIVENIGCSLKEDLLRRDFSINALAKNTVTNEIVDYFNGLDDLKNKKIRVLHKNSFIDDPTRIIRALKFSVRFNFELDNDTRKLQDDYLNNINYDMSYHRLKKELKETFSLNIEKAYEKFIKEGIYKLLSEHQKIPRLNTSIESLIKKYRPINTWLVYMGLFELKNFELNNEENAIIQQYNKIKELSLKSDIEIYKAFNSIPLESVLLYALTEDLEIATKFLDNLSKINLEINGDDLLKLGIKQGKIYKEIFDYVLEKKFALPSASKSEEIAWVKEMFL